MKLSLIVRAAGKMEGKAIPIALPQFLIGRDKQCHLRPASPLVSNRHCALQVRGAKAFVRDFESTNGTFVNDEMVKGERELHDQDQIRLGPMLFEVHLESEPVEAPRPAAMPAQPRPTQPNDDEAMAALLLSLPTDQDVDFPMSGVDSQGVPTGSTVMDMPIPAGVDTDHGEETVASATGNASPSRAEGDTAAAADELLKKYRRRNR